MKLRVAFVVAVATAIPFVVAAACDSASTDLAPLDASPDVAAPPPIEAGPDAADFDAAGMPTCPPPIGQAGVAPIVLPSGGTCTRYPFPIFGARDVFDSADGTIYVSENAEGRLSRLTDGGMVTVAGGFEHPVGIRQDDDGTLLLNDEVAGTLVRVDPSDGGVTPIASGLGHVTYLDLGADRTAYAGVFAQPGGVQRTNLDDGGSETIATGVFNPEGILVEGDASFLVSEFGNPNIAGARVLRFPLAGGARESVSSVAADGFDSAFAVIRSPRGGFVVAAHLGPNATQSVVREFPPNAPPRDLLRNVRAPTGLWFTKSGDLLVIEAVTVNTGEGWLLRVSGL